MQGLTEMDPAVLVVDDNDHVWQNHRYNLLRVERYMYFPSSMRHFGRSEKSLLERGR
jgi:RNA polymerase II C-terminal domain phosphatase-like 3/4